jgi:3-hydroxyisobutyrate dehydrogenase-like beta-hydroxyacid dehydrogenase
VLEHYAHHLDYVGPFGSGTTMKLVRNFLGYALQAATYEALTFARAAGIDLDAFRRVVDDSGVLDQYYMVLNIPTKRPITESSAGVRYFEAFMGLSGEQLVGAMTRGTEVMEKDMDEILALADEIGFEGTLAAHIRPLLNRSVLIPDHA